MLLFPTLIFWFAVLRCHLWHMLCIGYKLHWRAANQNLFLVLYIYHLWFDKNVRPGEIAIIHYDRGNIWSWKYSLGNSPVGEVFVGGSVHWRSVSRRSVLREVSVGELSGSFLRKYISMLFYFAHGDLRKELFIGLL